MRDNTFILFACQRYAVGRRSAGVSTIADYIAEHKDLLSKQEKLQMIDEINGNIIMDCAGDKCDIETWNGLISKLERTLNETN